MCDPYVTIRKNYDHDTDVLHQAGHILPNDLYILVFFCCNVNQVWNSVIN